MPGLRRHALWLIEHHPDHDVQAPALSPQFDPEGFAAAKKLWEAHLARPDVSPFVVYRAASFFAPHDKPYAEQLILRGMAMDPDSAALKARMPPDVGGYQWPMQLSSLYGAALRGSESAWGTYNDLRTHLDKVNSPYAKQVRAQARGDDRRATARPRRQHPHPPKPVDQGSGAEAGAGRGPNAWSPLPRTGAGTRSQSRERESNTRENQAARAGHRCRSSRQPRT